MSKESRDPEGENLVSSFESGIITLNKKWVGVCLKLIMYDHSGKLTHWPPDRFRDLMTALEEFTTALGFNAFMFRAKANPALVEDLPARHPYHTLLTERPQISADEVGRAKASTTIASSKFLARGPTFEMRIVYSDGREESILFHEYTALSMYGYLEEYLEAAVTLSGPPAGNA